jgi:hypothetical protein
MRWNNQHCRKEQDVGCNYFPHRLLPHQIFSFQQAPWNVADSKAPVKEIVAFSLRSHCERLDISVTALSSITSIVSAKLRLLSDGFSLAFLLTMQTFQTSPFGEFAGDARSIPDQVRGPRYPAAGGVRISG